MKRILAVGLVLPATAATATALYLSGLAAPVLYGAKLWGDAFLGYRPSTTDEPEIVA